MGSHGLSHTPADTTTLHTAMWRHDFISSTYVTLTVLSEVLIWHLWMSFLIIYNFITVTNDTVEPHHYHVYLAL